MKLKKLTLQGYNTFATKTEFIFDEGITSIVGPNGSGKSNIADALRWVLGEQSYGSLRGKRTIDMIFAGSQTRPRSGMAQATLLLDNADGWLPIDYSEVAISRRAYRTGENEYILNGQRVRLKDVLDLLATSGLAQRTYTIIGQGLIDQALSLRAEERRALFEEAAGINHYKARRAETLRRLKETQHNLERVHDILGEIRPRLASLKRQATRARNFEQIQQDLHHLLRIWYGFKWEKAKEELRLARETAVASEKSWSAGRKALLVQQQNIDDLQRDINRTQQRLTTTQDERDDVRKQLENLRREAAIQQERQKALKRQLEELAQELTLLAGQREAAAADLTAATAELSEAQATLQENQNALAQFNITFQEQQTEINRWQKTLKTTQIQQRDTQNKLAQSEGQLSQLRERLQEVNSTEDQSDNDDIVALQKTVAKQTAVIESTQTKAKELRQQRENLQTQRQAQIRVLKKLRQTTRDMERQLNKQRSQVARLETRVEMLDQQRQKEITIPSDITVSDQLAGLITIPETHKTALEAALAERLAAFVVSDRDDFWQLVQHNPKRALAVIAQNDTRPQPQPKFEETAVYGWASQIVKNKTQYQAVIDALMGHILLVRDQKSAYALAAKLPPGTVAVASDGFMVHATGLVETAVAGAKSSILTREANWRTAVEELTRAQSDYEAAEQQTSAQQEEIQTLQNQVDSWQQEERRLANLESELQQRAGNAQRQLDRAQQQQTFIQRQAESQTRTIASLRARIAEMEAKIERERETAVQLESSVSQAQASLAALPVAESQQQRDNLQQNRATAQTIVAGRQAVVDSRRATLRQLEGQIERLTNRQTSLTQQHTQLKAHDDSSTIQRLQEKLERLEMEIKPLQTRLAGNRDDLMGLQEETAVHQRHAHELENQYTQTKIKLTQRENQIEGLQERIKADLGIVALRFDDDQTGAQPLPISEVVESLPQVDSLPADIESTIQQYRGQLQRMGAINPDAPIEFNETQERFDFLNEQIEDLTNTDSQLREIIAELDTLTSKAFAATVDKVNIVFGETFTQLFGGGSARLMLTDPDDLTVSGVDIIARLPGRREQGLALLSGGERSLTASALIFSLLKVSPTPFCVMDEVDAALDEANINRFRDLLRELSLKTQFVVITHNRGTVQAADTIYGISMQPDSTSQVISIKPEEYIHQSML